MNLENLTWVWFTAMAVGFVAYYTIALTEKLWQRRHAAGGILVGWYTATFPLVFITDYPMWLIIIIASLQLYLIINAARWWIDRFHQKYLRYSVLRSAALLYLTMMGLAFGYPLVTTSLPILLGASLSLSLAVAVGTLWQAIWGLGHYQIGKIKPVVREKDLPTVTLAIPARNETHALQTTLNKAIQSDYPKLEIIVLDDCSYDKTAEIIRSFAHDGVRFVKGKQPAKGWLGKNYACEILAEEASGDVIIFAGVDTHFGPQTISYIVSYMIRKKAKMVSVLPERRAFDFLPTFLEQLRNYWQLVLPITNNRLPISSPCWAIDSDTLHDIGSFAAFRGSVFPEVHFARTVRKKNAYRFVMSNEIIQLTTRKRLTSQLETATRTFYPMLKRRPSSVFMVTFLLLIVYILPYVMFGYELITKTAFTWLSIGALLSMTLFTITHLLILRRTNPHGWLVGIINFPILILFDTLLFNWSMLSFEFGEVNWKGRNVCYPVLTTIPQKDFQEQLNKVA